MSETEHKIRLRQIESEDLAQMRDWRNSPRVRNICREYRLLTMQDQVNWFDQLRGDTTLAMFAIEAGATGEFIGVCGWTYIDWRSRHALLSMYIGEEEYDLKEWYLAVLRKLHKVAFGDLGMLTVRAEAYDFDRRLELGGRPLGIFHEAGYKVVGAWRDGYFHAYQSHEIILMDMTAREWRESIGISEENQSG